MTTTHDNIDPDAPMTRAEAQANERRLYDLHSLPPEFHDFDERTLSLRRAMHEAHNGGIERLWLKHPKRSRDPADYPATVQRIADHFVAAREAYKEEVWRCRTANKRQPKTATGDLAGNVELWARDAARSVVLRALREAR